jgi:hypothetical protein
MSRAGPWRIYGLCDADGSVRYVGATRRRELAACARQYHIWARSRSARMNRALQEWLLTLDGPPAVVLLDETTDRFAVRALVAQHVARCRAEGGDRGLLQR